MWYFLFFLFFFIQCDTPIVLMHGIQSSFEAMEPLYYQIKKEKPNVDILNVDIGGIRKSRGNFLEQVKKFAEQVRKFSSGFNAIGHSQGALIIRSYIQMLNDPPVKNFISLGGPLNGVFGMPGRLDDRLKFLNCLEGYAYLILYNKFLKKRLSVSSYWHDTIHNDKYLKYCDILPKLNHETPDYKGLDNLENLVLVNSGNEDIIEPAESCHFGFYAPGTRDIVKLYDSAEYNRDSLGLRKLAEAGKIHLRNANCIHSGYQADEDNFKCNVLPWLD